ncbi:MAG: hypothetical protein JSV63_03625 [Candidatus Aenigmatarchaeota archaeon]|nr:MAG: hypothetical protein JSV63_03625 [Candidatus Aenigmarchaeota archaeon]
MRSNASEKLIIPESRHRGLYIPESELSLPLIDNLGDWFSDGKPAYRLIRESAPLERRLLLQLARLDLERGTRHAKLVPEHVREAVRQAGIYEQEIKKGYAACHSDVIEFLPRVYATEGMWQFSNENRDPAMYYQEIKDLKETNDGWEKVRSEYTIVNFTLVPEGGIIVPRKDTKLWYYPCGIPLETTIDREEAIQEWVDVGLTEEQAERGLFKFHRPDEVSGLYTVISSYDKEGTFHISICGRPDKKAFDVGSYSMRRAA